MMNHLRKRILSVVMTSVMLLTTPIGSVKAAAEDTNGGKYVSDVFIAYGKTEDEARNWLENHGWEPVKGDFNAGKPSKLDAAFAAVMGIKRTNDPKKAVTDMAVMNMAGGYSFTDYEGLLKDKRAEISEIVNEFLPALHEFRDNYYGKGSEAGRVRAEIAYEILNSFYDGDPEDPYAKNDSGAPLGELFLQQTKQEMGNDVYVTLSKNEKMKHADLQQIIMEGSVGFISLVYETLSLAADSSEDSWLDRLSGIAALSSTEMAELYAFGSENLSDSAAESLLLSVYGETAAQLAEDYYDVQGELNWYQTYIVANKDVDGKSLAQQDDEDEEAYQKRITAFFERLKGTNPERYAEERQRFYADLSLDAIISSVSYEGEWGETLHDFFLPVNEDGEELTDYGADRSNFLPLAVALSDGQRSGMRFIKLQSLLTSATNNADAVRSAFPCVKEILQDVEKVSVYEGINRAIYRDCVALTSRVKMEANMGKNPFGQQTVTNTLYMIGGLIGMVIGTIGTSVGVALVWHYSIDETFEEARRIVQELKETSQTGTAMFTEQTQKITACRLRYWGSVAFFAVSVIIMAVSTIAFKEWVEQLYRVEFSKIPLLIVDESDIVSYITDADGNPVLDQKGEQKKKIEFNQYVYYEVVKCNRSEVRNPEGMSTNYKNYEKWGCYDAADLNGDVGRQWLALYTVKSAKKGFPIFADSLTYQTGSDAMPNGCTEGLHFFCYDYAVDLGDMAYCYNNDKNGVYFFWDSDESAYAASSFTKGQLALACVGGLVAGIFGTSLLLHTRRKRKAIPKTAETA